MVSARIAEAYGATLSLPRIVGRQGIVDVIEPGMSNDERQALRRSGETIRKAEMHHTHSGWFPRPITNKSRQWRNFAVREGGG